MRCDADRVRQILTNLIGNAIKFTEAGQVQVAAEARGDAVAIHVTDTGVGIPEADSTRSSRSSSRSTRRWRGARAGPASGLAIASRLARLMGGRHHR